jgi:hypothetical protein
VVEKRAPRYYGCGSNGKYRIGEGLEDHMYWCEKEEKYKVKGQLNWYISWDQIIGSTVSTALKFYRLVPVSSPDFIFYDPLLICNLEVAPDYKWKNPSAVDTVCTLRSDLTDIPVSKFKIKTNSSGERFYRVDFHLSMKVLDEVRISVCGDEEC